MGSLTLDELLDATGISEMAGTDLEKRAGASIPVSFSKLAERCRIAAETPSVSDNGLAEKTASIAIIQRTLSEIDNIVGPPEAEKTAQESSADRAEFIRAAIEEGHAPEDIAEFLEKQAFGGIGRALRTAKASFGTRRAVGAITKATGKAERNAREWENLLSRYAGASDIEKTKLFRSMYKDLGPEMTAGMMSKQVGKSYKGLPVVKQIMPKDIKPPAAPGAAAQTFEQQAVEKGKAFGKKYWKPAAMIGGGAYAGSRVGGSSGDSGSKGSGSGKNVNIIQ